jgi:glycerol-3-phosphate dehydrogenase (NAD(P)+)
MGVVLGNNLIRNKDITSVCMFVRRQDLYDQLQKNHRHPDYEALRTVPIPSNIFFSTSLKESLKDATHCVFAIPSRYSADMLRRMAPHFPSKCLIISLVKGFFFDDQNAKFFRISSLISQLLNIPPENVCSLGGPNIYQEIALNYSKDNPIHRPCNTVISSINSATAQEFQHLYFTKNILRTYYSDDIIASEVCGALKNVYALAAGTSDGYYSGKGMGINFKASLLTRANYEMSFFARSLGARPDNVYGLAGMGDLIATCTKGRNWEAGRQIISGKSAEEVQKAMLPNVLEGLQTLQVLHRLITSVRNANPNLCLELPILEAAHHFIYDGVSYEKCVYHVINRPMKKEIRTDPYLSIDN